MKTFFKLSLCLAFAVASSVYGADKVSGHEVTKEVVRRIVSTHKDNESGYAALDKMTSRPNSQGNVQFEARKVGDGFAAHEDDFTQCKTRVLGIPGSSARMILRDCSTEIPAEKLKNILAELRAEEQKMN